MPCPLHRIEWKYGDTTSAIGIGTPEDIPYKFFDTGEEYLQEQAIKNALDINTRKKIREAVKQFLTTEVKTEARKQVKALTRDIIKLKKDKKEMEDVLAELKRQMTTSKAEIESAIVDLTKLMERHSDEILRFRNMEIE